ncbi:MAG: BBP7 family outer membrane beta-barrel protein [Planctomycetota bacterium]
MIATAFGLLAATLWWRAKRGRGTGHVIAVVLAAWCGGAGRAQEVPLPEVTEPAMEIPSATAGAFRGVGPAEPLWTSYALADALFWQRDNQAANRPLAITVGDGATVLRTSDLQFPVAAGVRTFYGQRSPEDGGWEVGYFGLYGQTATNIQGTIPPNYIQLPDPLGGNLTEDGEFVTAKYSSVLNSAEVNLFATDSDWFTNPSGWDTLDWLAGFRYVGVEEDAVLATDCCRMGDEFFTIPYRARTRNNMFGAQLGVRGRRAWERWAVEGWAKAALMGVAQEQIQDQLVDYTGFVQRPALSRSGGEVGFVGDLTMSAIYRITDVWGIRAGYSLLWLEGLALAPDQFDFSTNAGAGTQLVNSSGIFYHGANLGLEARW